MLASLWYSLQFAACSLKLVCSAPISEGELQFVEVIFSPLYQYFTDSFISMFKHHCVTWRNTVVKIHTPCPCKEVVARDTAELNSPSPSPSYSRVYLFKHILQITFLCSFHGRHPRFFVHVQCHPVPHVVHVCGKVPRPLSFIIHVHHFVIH